MKRGPMKMPKTWTEAQRRFPDAVFECVGKREELVIYTGLTPADDSADERLRRLTDAEYDL